MPFVSRNPATEEVLTTYPEATESSIDQQLDSLSEAFQEWSRVSSAERLKALTPVFEKMKRHSSALAEMMSLEMGKPIQQAAAEVSKSLSLEGFYKGSHSEVLRTKVLTLNFGKAEIHRRPLGVILGIMPWNFPVWQVMRFAVPTLLAGNCVAVKHSPTTQGVARLIESFFKPLPVYKNLAMAEAKALKRIDDPRIAAVSLTGSVRAGRAVAEVAGRSLKKAVLELGGSDAYLIFDDAKIPEAARACAESRMINAGQSCISAKRFIVHRKVAKAFEEAFRSELQKFTPADPLKPSCQLGPIAREDLRDQLHRQVRRSISKGAKLKLGGLLPKDRGFFYAPTLLSDVTPGMATFDEEVFGPVASISVAKTNEEIMALANKTSLGLGGCIFSEDIERAKRFAIEEIQSGMVGLNLYVRSDPALPFGGIKESGYGRELGSEGLLEFVNTKVVMQV